MAGGGKKRKSVILRLLLLVFVVYSIISLNGLLVDLTSINREKEDREALLAEKNLQIDEYTELLKSGNERKLIEKTARERLGYYYPNEEVYADLSGQ